MKLKHVLAVAGLAVALSQSVAVQAVVVGPLSSGYDSPINSSVDIMREITGISCLQLLAKFDVDENKWTGPHVADFTINGLPGSSGTWSSSGVGALVWVVKGGPNFQYWQSDEPVTSGDWTNAGLPPAGNSRSTPGVSHIDFYGCKPVPETGSILAGLTAIGMFALGRKRLA